MGACQFKVRSTGKTAEEAYQTACDYAEQEYGSQDGYNGTISTTHGFNDETEMYAKSVDKFMVRHFVKPGITGLAQVSGFRGEVESDKDIIGRVKHDIFYIENWSLLLDLKIIIQTILIMFKGEEKAY